MNIFKNWLYSSIESRFFSLVFCSSLSFIFLFLCQKGIYEHACGLFPSSVLCGCSKYDWYAFSYRFSDHFLFSSYWPLWASRGFLHSILVWWRREHGWWMHSHSKQLPPNLFPEYVAISFEIFPFACLTHQYYHLAANLQIGLAPNNQFMIRLIINAYQHCKMPLLYLDMMYTT